MANENQEQKEVKVIYVKLDVFFTSELLGAVSLNAQLYQDHMQKKAVEAGILSQDKADAEVAGIKPEEMEMRGQTGFLMYDGYPHLSGHVIKGVIKEKMALMRYAKHPQGKLPAYKKKADLLVAVLEPFIRLYPPSALKVPVWETVDNPQYDPTQFNASWEGIIARLENDEEVELSHANMSGFEAYVATRQPPQIRAITGYKLRKGGMGLNSRPLRAETARGPRVAIASSRTCDAGTTMTAHLRCQGDYANVKRLQAIFDCCRYHGFGQWRSAAKGTAICKLTEIDGPPDEIYYPAELPALSPTWA